MKNLKKVLALVVALTMVFTTVAFASYPDVDATADYAGAVELLSVLEVLQGDENGNFNPDNTITRAEFAAVVCRALGLEGSAASAKGATMFTDVAADHWASGYINLASQQGIVNGKGNGIFDPEGNVTYAEAVKMLVVAIGYEPMAATKGGYPAGYLSVANSTKMTAGVAGASDVAALRSTVAMLTANALEIPVMDQTAFGSETKYEPLDDFDNYTSLLTNMDIFKATGVITGTDELNGEFTVGLTEGSDDFAFGWNTNGYEVLGDVTFKIGESNALEYAAENVDVYVKKDGRKDYVALIVVPSGIGETLEINSSSIDETNVGKAVKWEYYETVDATKTTKIDVAANAIVYVNGNKITTFDKDGKITANVNDAFFTTLKDLDAKIKFIENSDDKDFDIIDITVYEHAIVDEVLASKNRIVTLNSRVQFDEDNDDQLVTIVNAEGAEIALEDIQAGDVLAMVVYDDLNDKNLPQKAVSFKEKIVIYDLGASSVTGVVNQEGDEEIYIDSVPYEYVTDFVSEKDYDDLFKSGKVKLGTEGTFYLGITGKIIGFAGVEGALNNYAFILAADVNTGATFDHCYEVKLLLADGTIKNYAIDDEVTIIDGKTETKDVKYDKQGDYFKVSKYAKLTKGDKETADEFAARVEADLFKRTIDFKVNSKGVITEVTYIYKDSKDANDYASVNGDFREKSNKVDSKALASDAVIFNIDVIDADDATVVGIDSLVDEGTYEGYVFAKDDEYAVFVLTAGTAKFDAEANINVVTNIATITYGEDNVEAKEVKYLSNGEEGVAIFTDEANSIAGDYTKLNKGSIFVANVAADGLVDDYAVIATVNDKRDGYVMVQKDSKDITGDDIYGKDSDVDFAIGYIETIDGSLVKVSSLANELRADSAVAQYYYAKGSSVRNDKVEFGYYDGNGVDEKIDNKVNNVFVKLYDGEEQDLVAFQARVELK